MEDEYISDMAESKLELESGELNLFKNIFISIFWMPLLFSVQKTRLQRRFFFYSFLRSWFSASFNLLLPLQVQQI